MNLNPHSAAVGAMAFVLLVGTPPAFADIAVSANDAHTVMVNGAQVSAGKPVPDTVSIIDMGRFPPRLRATIDVPASVVGPPMAVAVAPDESYAIVTSSTKLDPADPSKIVADGRVSVIDLRVTPPKLVQQVHAGSGAAAVRISPDGLLALVPNRNEGTVSIFTISKRRLQEAGKLDLGNQKALPSGVVFLPDGKSALLSRYGDNMVSVLHINGTQVTLDPQPITTGIAPYTMDISRDGRFAAVSNMGRGNGDIDTVSLIDLTRTPFRTVETTSVGVLPEGLRFSPDGHMLAVGTQGGTTKPDSSPLHDAHGKLVLLALDGAHLRRIADAPTGRWTQGIAFSRDGHTIVVQDMVERRIEVFRWQRDRLLPAEPISLGAGAAAIGTAAH